MDKGAKVYEIVQLIKDIVDKKVDFATKEQVYFAYCDVSKETDKLVNLLLEIVED